MPTLLVAAITSCGADGATDPTTETTSPVVTTTAPATSTTTSTSVAPTGNAPGVTPPVVQNPPPVVTSPVSPVPAVPTTGAPINPNPVPVPQPPASTSEETGSEPDSSAEDTTPTASSGETSEPPPEPPAAGFYTKDGALYDVNGTEFVMRGVNYPYAWYKDNAQQRFADMATAGANTVRVVMATGAQWTKTSGSEVSNIISWAKANKMVAMLEVHDSTGYGESEAAPHPEQMLGYWKSAEILDAIKGQEAYVLVNIANEAFGNNTSDEWQSYYTMAVADLRQAGIKHTFIVDAPNWGQDWDNCMRDGKNGSQTMTCDAQAVYDADPDHNTMFSVHMYDVYGTGDVVRAYFDRFLSKGLPFLVGEFAADHGDSGNVDEDTILALSEQHGIGYLGWSWSGNGAGLETLDITNNFAPSNLTTWGERLLNGENGLKQTSAPCSCFE
jgi:mannan endo-1,4-beta-mannosidase